MKRKRGQSPDTGPLTALERSVLEYLEWLLVRGYTEATARSKGKRLRRLAGWLAERGISRPEEVTRPALERFQRWLYHYRKADGAPLSFSNQHGVLVAVQGFFRWLVKSGRLPSNPASELELPKLERRLPKAVLTAAEAEAVLAAVFENQGPGVRGQGSAKDRGESSADPWTLSPDPSSGPCPLQPDPLKLRDRAILEVFYSTGMRRKELAGLKLYDLDVERGTVAVRQGKGKKDRVVPLGERAAAWLDAYVTGGRPQLSVEPDGGWLFLTRRGDPFDPDSLSFLVRGYVDRSGVGKKGSCHLFRHTMATLMLEGGADIRFIQQMLGHANLNTTEIYTRVSVRKLVEVHAATHPGARLRRVRTGDGSPETGVVEAGKLLTVDRPPLSEGVGMRATDNGEQPTSGEELRSFLAAETDGEITH